MNKGQYYKMRAKGWLEQQGYQTAYLEQMRRIVLRDKDTGELKTIFTKQDQLASDLLAVSENEIIFIQVKLGKKNIADGIKQFSRYKFPPFAKKWVISWQPRAREPEIIEA